MKYYAGIGSRETLKEICDFMTYLAMYLEKHDYTLRSGADIAFENGTKQNEIFTANGYIPQFAFDSVYKYYPSNYMKPYAEKLMARNYLQICGLDNNSLVDFVICWTPDGCENHKTRSRSTGGTGQAISIASDKNIAIYNLKNQIIFDLFYDLVFDNYNLNVNVFKSTFLEKD